MEQKNAFMNKFTDPKLTEEDLKDDPFFQSLSPELKEECLNLVWALADSLYSIFSRQEDMKERKVHPGIILSEEIRKRGIRVMDLAFKIKTRPDVLNLILKGKAGIDQEMAERLQEELGYDAQFWLDLQSAFDQTNTFYR